MLATMVGDAPKGTELLVTAVWAAKERMLGLRFEKEEGPEVRRVRVRRDGVLALGLGGSLAGFGVRVRGTQVFEEVKVLEGCFTFGPVATTGRKVTVLDAAP